MLTGVERASELRPGLWRWDAFHPSYQQDVTSVLVATDDDVLLVDPLAPRGADGAPFWRALDDAVEAGRRLTVAVTVPDHARSMPAIAARYPAATVHAAVATRQRSLAGVADRAARGRRQRSSAAGSPTPPAARTSARSGSHRTARSWSAT